jgi:hypothetical protein
VSERPATLTTFTTAQLLAALDAACVAQLGQPVSHETTSILAGQIALETANGERCFDWDVGNFKAVPGADFQNFHTWEIIDGARVEMVCAFAVFSSLQAGVESYLHAMYTRWGAAWHFACLGDADGFAQALKVYGYYTADEGEYARGVAARAAYYLRVLGGDADTTMPELPALTAGGAAVLATDGLLDT